MRAKTSRVQWAAAIWLCLAGTPWAGAADGPTAVAETQQPAAAATRQLAIQQGSIADKYTKLEKLLEDMARIEAVSDPRRAALLTKALQLSKENLTGVKLDRCVKSLEQFEAKNKAEREGLLGLQRETHQEMKTLLELLLSENRSDRLKREQDRIREYIQEVERILRLQKSVQGRTEGGGEPHELAQDQGKIAERTDDLARQIRENEEGGSPPAGRPDADGQTPDPSRPPGQAPDPGEPQEPPQEQAKPDEQPRGDQSGQDSQGQPQGQDQQPGDGSESSPKQEPSAADGEGKPSPNQQQPGKQQPGKPQPGDGQDPTDQGQADSPEPPDGPQPPRDEQEHPARKRLEAARQRMREAQKKLDEAQRQDALAEQQQAKEELERAKAELERILRQMREEEVERVLALLESRFRKMLEIQVRIYDETVRLGKIPEAERDLKVPIPAGKLAVDQRKLVVEADKALNLLLDEGSSVAFPETVTQMRDDMQQVADRLDAAKVEEITQGIEQDIIAALQEMIEALQKAQRDLEKQQQEQQQAQPGQPQEMPLVDAIAELKMIRALQMRVNLRTQRYARLLDDTEDPVGQATDGDLREALIRLAERQETIYRLTRDIVLGKNQ